jgi:DNA-binding transcriptional LysR family regulator
MRRKIPTTQALACFEAAARHGSFTRAAQELNLTQGAISRQVAALEDFLGVPLFKRSQHGMALTPAGVDYASRVRRQLDTLERDALDLMGRQGEGDALTLAVVPTFANRWLIPRLPGLMQLHPELQVHIEVRTRPFLFTDSGIDAAVYAGTPEQVQQWVGVQALPLLAEQVVPVCSPRLMLQQATRPEAWRQWFDALGVDAPKAMAGPRYELFSMQATAAAAGLGVALMPTLLIQDELARGTLVVACDPVRSSGRHYWLVHPSRPERPALAAFRDWLLGQAAGDVG